MEIEDLAIIGKIFLVVLFCGLVYFTWINIGIWLPEPVGCGLWSVVCGLGSGS